MAYKEFVKHLPDEHQIHASRDLVGADKEVFEHAPRDFSQNYADYSHRFENS
jgi:hypothetical protein